MKRAFALIYVLVLIVQLPHVASVYGNLELTGYGALGWPLALAFDLSVAVFTYRIVVERSTRRTTRWGLAFFLVAASVANATYYSLAPAVMAVAMPWFATVALPLSLALFASEFGAEVVRDERRAHRAEHAADAPAAISNAHQCKQCGRLFAYPGQYANSRAARNALSAHLRVHSNAGR